MNRRRLETALLWIFGVIIVLVAFAFIVVLLGAGVHGGA